MLNINKAIVIGRITQNLEVKTTPTGKQVLAFSVATNYSYKNQAGEKIEETEFHNIVSWGKQAEIIAQYFVKGQEIYVEGRLMTRNWVDETTQKKMYRTEINLEKFDFGAKPQGAESTPESRNKKRQEMNEQYGGGAGAKNEMDYPEEEIAVEDIPF